MPVHVLLYTLPGVPSIYYGSEFGIDGRKERYSDDSLRPALSLQDYKNAIRDDRRTALIAALGRIRQNTDALSYGDYRELVLTNRQYAFSRNHNGESVVVAVNNDDHDAQLSLPAENAAVFVDALTGQEVPVNGGRIWVNIPANSGGIWVPKARYEAILRAGGTPAASESHPAPETQKVPVTAAVQKPAEPAAVSQPQNAPEPAPAAEAPKAETPATAAKEPTQAEKPASAAPQVAASVPEMGRAASAASGPQADPKYKEAFDKGVIAGPQEAILAIMSKNGPITDQMRRDVMDNVYHDSLITWVKSFR